MTISEYRKIVEMDMKEKMIQFTLTLSHYDIDDTIYNEIIEMMKKFVEVMHSLPRFELICNEVLSCAAEHMLVEKDLNEEVDNAIRELLHYYEDLVFNHDFK